MVDFLGIVHPRGFQKQTIYSSFIQEKGVNQTFNSHNLELLSSEPLIFFHQAIRILFEGEVVNRKDVVRALLQGGQKVDPDATDQTLIYHAYLLWGDFAFEHLDGDFFCCLIDEKRRKFFVVRDFIGKKPIYWSLVKGRFFFSSQLKMLLSTGLIPQIPSLIGCSSYLHFGYIPQDLSAIKQVFKLLPGHVLKVNFDCEYALKQCWSYSSFFKENPLSESESIKQLEQLKTQLHEKIKKASGVSVLCENSQGQALIQSLIGNTQASFYSTKQLFQSEKPMISVDEAQDLLPSVIWDLEEPVAAFDSLFYAFLMKKETFKDQLLLFDTGCFETTGFSSKYDFSNQQNYVIQSSLYQKIAHLDPFYFKLFLKCFSLFAPSKKWKLLRNQNILSKQEMFSLYNSLFKEIRRKEISPVLYPYFDPEIFIQRFHRLNSIQGDINPLLYFDMKTRIPDRNLFQIYKTFANQTFDYQIPFLRFPTIDFFAHLPEKYKGFNDKNLLSSLGVQQVQNTYPNQKSMETYRPYFKKLEKGFLIEEGLISKKWLDKHLLFPEFTSESFNQLWAALVLEVWFRMFINTPVFLIDKQVYEAK